MSNRNNDAPPALPAPLNAELIRRADSAENALGVEPDDDIRALTIWLRAHGARSPRTMEAYKREANRLLVWLKERQLLLSEMTARDAEAFLDHLKNPPAHWIAPRKASKNTQLSPTQLLVGPLSSSSVNYSRKVLRHLMRYLQDAKYLRHNVFTFTGKRNAEGEEVTTSETEVRRYLDVASWQYLKYWLESMPIGTKRENAHAARARWVFHLLYHTGIRCSEAVSGRLTNFRRLTNLNGNEWVIKVEGKGRKVRYVPANSSLMAEHRRFLSSLEPLPGSESCDDLPLIPSVHRARRNEPLSRRSLSNIVREIAYQAARECEDEHIKRQIEQMTTHWLRHTNATHRFLAGASLESTQDALGHASPQTTRIYVQTTDHARQADAELLSRMNKKLDGEDQ